ncbi:MAG: hypothetical protein HY851_12465, partial [candidate division Zixibacteria bacterium]|nr:hypothetical protein [candidate division Zixibacteria bacterium]
MLLVIMSSGPAVYSGILQDPSLVSITIYESTGSLQAITFVKSDTRLVTDINQSPPDLQFDFRGTPLEYYDVFVSGPTGQLDQQGNYLTIECHFDQNVAGVGNNIDAVSLNYSGGVKKWVVDAATWVAGDPEYPGEDPNVDYAAGPSDDRCTYMGYHYSRLTLAFQPIYLRPVVLVHGWTGSAGSWGQFKRWLENDGFVYVWPVSIDPCGPVGEKDFDKNAEILSNQIETKLDALGYRSEFDIVAHSMGGLVARRYISPGSSGKSWSMLNRERTVMHLIMLGTPNSGSNLASVSLTWLFKAGKVGGPLMDAYTYFKAKCTGPAKSEFSTPKMALFNARYEDNFTTDYRVVAGTYYANCLGDQAKSGFGFFEGCPNDGVVGIASVFRAIPYWPIRSNHPVIRKFIGEWRALKHGDLIRNESLAHAVAGTLASGALNDGAPSPDLLPFSIDSTIDSILAPFSGSSVVVLSSGATVVDSLSVPNSSGATFCANGYGIPVKLSAVSPMGITYDSTSTQLDSSVIYSADSNGTTLFVSSPAVGQWRLQVSADSLTDP